MVLLQACAAVNSTEAVTVLCLVKTSQWSYAQCHNHLDVRPWQAYQRVLSHIAAPRLQDAVQEWVDSYHVGSKRQLLVDSAPRLLACIEWIKLSGDAYPWQQSPYLRPWHELHDWERLPLTQHYASPDHAATDKVVQELPENAGVIKQPTSFVPSQQYTKLLLETATHDAATDMQLDQGDYVTMSDTSGNVLGVGSFWQTNSITEGVTDSWSEAPNSQGYGDDYTMTDTVHMAGSPTVTWPADAIPASAADSLSKVVGLQPQKSSTDLMVDARGNPAEPDATCYASGTSHARVQLGAVSALIPELQAFMQLVSETMVKAQTGDSSAVLQMQQMSQVAVLAHAFLI